MSRFIVLFLLFFSFLSAETPSVLVTIEPYEYIVKAIADDTIDVKSFMTGSINIHDYEPTIRQMQEAYSANVWFKIGELFEDKLENKLKQSASSMKIVSLLEGLPLLSSSCNHSHGHEHRCNIDPHVWLSFRQLVIQVQNISKVLQELNPKYAEVYQKNTNNLISKLIDLDAKWSKKFKEVDFRKIYLVHSAFAYFCDDYNLEQVPLEHHGQEISQRQFIAIYHQAQELGIKVIFTQPGYRSKSAAKISQLLDIEILEVDPYSKNVIENLDSIANLFYNSLKD